MVTSEKSAEHVFILPAVVDITCAAVLHKELQEACEHTGRLVLKAAAVERMTTPAVQLITSLAVSLKQQNKQLVIAEPADAVVNVFSDLGLTAQFNEWRS